MTPSLDSVSTALVQFMRGGSYWSLYRAVLEAADRIDPAADLADRDVQWFDQLQELVYMGSAGPISEADREQGLIDADELRARIREAKLEDWGPRPA